MYVFLLTIISLLTCNILCVLHQDIGSKDLMKKAIVIGASSGMGREVAKLLTQEGYKVGIAARRINLLEEIKENMPSQICTKRMDVSNPSESLEILEELINELGGLDLLIISVTGFDEVKASTVNWTDKLSIFEVDLIGFYAIAKFTMDFFEKQEKGHFVGITSIDGLRGIAKSPEYSATKAFCSRYMEAKRNYFIQKKLPIVVTDVLPGWVNSKEEPDFAQKHPEAYWFESLNDASKEIVEAIHNKESIAYITKRWKQVADTLKTMPDELYNALGGL